MTAAQAAITALQGTVAGMQIKPIETATDLNSLDVGLYLIGTEEISGTLLNKPTTSTSTGFIHVIEGGTDGQLIQIYCICSKAYPIYYQRAFYQNSWGEWTVIDITDSGWKALPLTSGITGHNASNFPCRYRRIGKTVHIQGCVTGFADVEKVVANIPEGYRPAASFYTLQATQGGNVDTFNVRTNGEIKRMSTTMPVASLSATNYHFINFSYLID